MLNLPNTITVIRILLVPLFLAVFWSSGPNRVPFSMGILAAAGLSDILDGFLARRYNMVTPVGKILDPAADKLMTTAAMVSLYLLGSFPLWLAALILVKDVVVVFGGSILILKENMQVSANIYGKTATILVYTALFSAAFDIRGRGVIAVTAGIVSAFALINYLNSFIRRRAC